MSDALHADTLIAATFRQVLDEAGPRQAEVLRRCAIPRWFDAELLAVLRERADGNERVLLALTEYSFVRPVGEGRYALQDAVRAALLAEWRADRATEFLAISRRLADHFAARAAAAVPSQLHLPNLTISMRPPGDWDLWAREALYHRLVADPAAGLALLLADFDRAEATYRMGEAEALLQVAGEVPLDLAGQRWLRYLRARLGRAALQLDQSAAQLEALLAEPGLAPDLAGAARQTLADVLAETGQWVRAIELYRDSLAHFEQVGDRGRAAAVMLRLGEAYRGLATNAGGWYVPAYAQSAPLRRLGLAWYWLLALPFRLAARFLRRTPWALPRPDLLASYQNWLIARIFRTAQGWYARARRAFIGLGDEVGLLQAEQQQAEILLLFGYLDDGLAQLDALRARPAAQDAYRRLWIDTARALAQIERGERAAAQALLAELLPGFRALGELRGEAAVLALQGRAGEDGDPDAALASYANSLARFRALRYTAAREQALYALRAWQRRVGPGPISQRISALLDDEPEKRYVARFPRSLLPLLQALVVGAAPATFLLATLVSTSQTVRRIGNSPILEIGTSFNLWNVLVLLVLLGLLNLALYGLVGLALIFFIPLDALEREQPDYLITDEQGIARYDYRGALAMRMAWADLRHWIRIDRRIWQRPMALFSQTFLEAADGRDLRIDAITGWYNGLQGDIALHLRRAGNPAQPQDRGLTMLASKSGALLLAGVLLLGMCIATDNQWSDAMVRLLPPALYTVIYLLAFSGALILVALAYWLVTHPLAIDRELGLRSRWPWVVGAVGLGAVLLVVLGRAPLPVPALNIGILIWGAYLLAEAIYTLAWPSRPRAGYALIAAAVLLACALSFEPGLQLFTSTLSRTYSRQQNYDGAQSTDLGSLPAPNSASDESDLSSAAAWQRIGNAAYLKGDFAGAAQAYTNALRELPSDLSTDALRSQAAVILYNRARALQRLGGNPPESQPDSQPGAEPDDPGSQAPSSAEQDLERACELASNLCGRVP